MTANWVTSRLLAALEKILGRGQRASPGDLAGSEASQVSLRGTRQFGEDMRDVGLDRPSRQEEPGGDIDIREALAHQTGDSTLGHGQGVPTG
jgi:hypothetical protein